jgi:hypothetical protein
MDRRRRPCGNGARQAPLSLVLDTRFGRKVLAESNDIGEIVGAVTHYVAARLIERERALAEDSSSVERLHRRAIGARRRSRLRAIGIFVLGLLLGVVVVVAALLFIASGLQPD